MESGSLSPARILGGLIALDQMLLKAKGKDDAWTRTRALEARLLQVLTAVFFRRARQGVREAASLIAAGGDGPVGREEAVRAVARVRDALADFPVEVAPMLGQIVGASYMLGKELGLTQAYHDRDHEPPATVTKVVGKPKLPKVGVGSGPGGSMFESWMKNLSPAEWHKYEVQVLEAAGKHDEASKAKATFAAKEHAQAQEDAKKAQLEAEAIAFKHEMAMTAAAEKAAEALKTKEAAALAEKAALAAAKKQPNIGAAAPAGGMPPPKKGVGQGKGGGPKPGGKFLEVKPSFTLVDEKAVASLGKMQGNWIGQFYNDQLSGKVQSIASNTLIEQGLPRKEAAAALENTLSKEFGYSPDVPWMAKPEGIGLPGGWHGTPTGYFEMLAANVTSNARNTGQIRSYSEIGITHYEVMNPEDEKTCEDCGFMNGKVFEVEDAVSHIDKVVDADTPDEVRDLHPWKGKDDMIAASGASAKAGHVSHDDSKKLADSGFSLPTYHGKCRCSVDIAADSKIVWDQPAAPAAPPEAAPEPMPAAAPEQLPLTFAEPALPPPPAPVVALPPPAPAPSPMAAQPPAPPPAPGVFPWSEKLTKLPIELDGVHTKYVFQDPEGEKWIFKPQEDFRAQGDTMAAEMARLLGVDTAEVYQVKLRGNNGSIQKMFPNEGSFKGISPATLSPEQMVQIQREHAFDWLISQHDTHEGNVLRMADGSLRFIDKGQTFRYFGTDQLTLGYGAYGKPNPVETYYHTTFNAYARGAAVKVSPLKALEPFLAKVEATSDKAFLDALRPYADSAWAAGEKNKSIKQSAWMGRFKTKEDFYAAVLERKNNLRADLTKFYSELEKVAAKNGNDAVLVETAKKPRKKPTAAAAKLPELAQTPATTLHPDVAHWDERLKEAHEAGWAGSSVMAGAGHFEGSNLLLYGADGDGTFLEGTLNKEAGRKFEAAIKAELGKTEKAPPEAVVDPFFEKVKAVAVSFNAHMDPKHAKYDGVIPPHTAAAAEILHSDLTAYAKSTELKYGGNRAAISASPEGQIFDHYSKFLFGSANDGGIYDTATKKFRVDGLGKKIEAPTIKPPPAAEPAKRKKGALPAGWSVEKTTVGDAINREYSAGRITMKPGAPRQTLADTAAGVGNIYKFSAPDGTTVFYRPHEAKTAIGVQGQVRVWVDDKIQNLKGERMKRAFDQLGELGINTTRATKDDLEATYLRKLAFKVRLDEHANKIGSDLPATEQIEKLKAMLKENGLKFGANYKPAPTFEQGGGQKGWAQWYGHHADQQELDKVSLFHNLHNGIAEDLERILSGKSRTLVSTTEKIRMGLPPGGMSPEEDMRTGGARFAFTRIRMKGSMERGVYFKSEALTNLDAISYTHDKYGRTAEADLKERILQKANAGQPGYVQVAQNKSSDETIFRANVALDKYLERVVVENAKEKREVISRLNKNGITHVGDRKLEDIIEVIHR